MSLLRLPAPAKLNLMLLIVGQRADGYHELQTLFQFVDYGDTLTLALDDDASTTLTTAFTGIPGQQNLIYRAAEALRQATGCRLGAAIQVEKRLPMGGGLGGGSSNAATTLLGLNQLWQTGLSLPDLATIGLPLGADVPVFVHGHAAWAEGVGEQLTAVTLPEPWFLVITPLCEVSTAQIFSNRQLTRNTSPITIAAALEQGGQNDCEKVVRTLYPEVDQALNWLSQFAEAKMTGTGASVFASFDTAEAAESIHRQLPSSLKGFVARACNQSPLHRALDLEQV